MGATRELSAWGLIWITLAACHGRSPHDSAETDTVTDSDSDVVIDTGDTTDTEEPDTDWGCERIEPDSNRVDLETATADCWYGEEPSATLGYGVRAVGSSVAVGRPGEDEDALFGMVVVGSPVGSSSDLTAGQRIKAGEAGAAFGIDFASLNGTLAIGLLDNESGHVYLMPIQAGDTSIFADSTAHIGDYDTRDHYNYQFGTSLGVADATDTPGDELVVGAPDPQRDRGAVLVYPLDLVGDQSIDSWSARVESAGGRFGQSMDTADIDADGRADILVGAPLENVDGMRVGAAYVLCTPLPATSTPEDACLRLGGEGGAVEAEAGSAVRSAGDIDADGYDDLLVGDQWASQNGTHSGRAYYVRGNRFGDLSLADADATFTGERSALCTGRGLAGDFDYDGDGVGDIAIGAPGDASQPGQVSRVYVFRGPLAGALDVSEALVYTGRPHDYAGFSIAALPDIDGDGRDELAVGAPYDTDFRAGGGKLYLLHGEWPE